MSIFHKRLLVPTIIIAAVGFNVPVSAEMEIPVEIKDPTVRYVAPPPPTSREDVLNMRGMTEAGYGGYEVLPDSASAPGVDPADDLLRAVRRQTVNREPGGS